MGIFIGDFLKIEPEWLLGFLGGFILVLVVFWRDIFWRLVLFILIGLIGGLTYYRIWDNRQFSKVLPFGHEVSFVGEIIDHPDFFPSQARYRVSYQEINVQIIVGRYPEYHYGDKLMLKGALKKPNDYLFRQGILGEMFNPEVQRIGRGGKLLTRAIYQVRDRFEASLNRSLSEPYASFAAGLVLGSKGNIPDSLTSDFNRTGTTHIIAVSGYNVTIIIIYIGLFLGLFSRKLRFWGSILAILAFVVMTGAPASVIRAGILAGLITFGRYQGRRINMLILILLTASTMLLFNPYALKYDLSFELSFLAFIGLVYLSPLVENLKLVRWLPKNLKSSLSETLGAQLMVLPILIFSFGRVSLLSPIVNVLILWLIPLSMLLVFLVGISGLISIGLGQIAGFLGWFPLKYIIVVVETFSKIPWVSLTFKTADWWWMVIFYGVIGLAVLKLKRQGKFQTNLDEKY